MNATEMMLEYIDKYISEAGRSNGSAVWLIRESDLKAMGFTAEDLEMMIETGHAQRHHRDDLAREVE